MLTGVFRSSKAICLGLADQIKSLVNKGTNIDATEPEHLIDLRTTLVKKFARLKGSWENLLQSYLDFEESVVFTSILELVELTEEATDNALFHSEDLLWAIDDGNRCDNDGPWGMDDMNDADLPPNPQINATSMDVIAEVVDCPTHQMAGRYLMTLTSN